MDKLKALWRLLFSKKFMLLTGSGNKIQAVTNYAENEVSRSKKAIYIH